MITQTVTTGAVMPKKIAILDYENDKVIIRSLPVYVDSESLFNTIDTDGIQLWLSDNGYSDDVDYMVGDFEIIIDN